MNWIDKLEQKYGRFAIHNLTNYIIICYIIGYLLQIAAPQLLSYLSLDFRLILRGQIWRLFTWVLYPPNSSSVLFFVIAVFFFYLPIGRSLEALWGSFRYTLYIFSGLFLTVVGALLLYVFTGNIITLGGVAFPLPARIFSPYYISLSIFLAYALSYPDARVLLWFVIPIKMSWMAIVYGLLIAYDVFSYVRAGMWFMIVPIACSLLNFAIFYFSTKNLSRFHPKDVKRRADFRKAVEPASRVFHTSNSQISKHKCAICGQTELDNPDLEFRFCSKCNGNYEYCQNHLFTHEHVK